MKDKLEFVSKDLSVACKLNQAEQAARQDEVEDIFNSYDEIRELSRGYAFRFPGEPQWLNRLIEFIQAERECCPFFTFSLIFEPGQGPLWLQLEGGEAVKEFVKIQFKINSGTFS